MVLELEKSIDETGIHKMSYLLTDICRFYRSECPLGLRSAKPLAVDWSKSADMNN